MSVLYWMRSTVAEGASGGAHLLVFHRLDWGIALAGVLRALAHGCSVVVQTLAHAALHSPSLSPVWFALSSIDAALLTGSQMGAK